MKFFYNGVEKSGRDAIFFAYLCNENGLPGYGLTSKMLYCPCCPRDYIPPEQYNYRHYAFNPYILNGSVIPSCLTTSYTQYFPGFMELQWKISQIKSPSTNILAADQRRTGSWFLRNNHDFGYWHGGFNGDTGMAGPGHPQIVYIGGNVGKVMTADELDVSRFPKIYHSSYF